MTDKQCKDCKYFIQHYIFTEGAFRWVNCGHCCREKTISKPCFHRACQHFEQGIPETEKFVTKKYLSKELIEFMTRLDLPPVVHDV